MTKHFPTLCPKQIFEVLEEVDFWNTVTPRADAVEGLKSLIDAGYFKGDVLESKVSDNKKVEANDYVYVERDRTTKAITNVNYLGLEDSSICNDAVKAIGDVSIVVSPSGFSSYKDITINYKVKNYYNISDYTYEYEYDKSDVLTVISDEGATKKLKVTDNGTIRGYILENGEKIAEGVKEITDIDKEPPVITAKDIVKIYGSNFDLFEGVTITDNSGEIASKNVYLGDKEITVSTELSVGENIVTYIAEDKFGNVSEAVKRKITLVVADKEFDYLEEDQIYPVEADGTYIVEAYGAQGGNNGGKGGYVKAEIPLKQGDILIINTGGINGYNGGGAYRKSKYISGGGATTVRYNNNYVIIAAGGGAQGSEGTPGDGGEGNGNGGEKPHDNATAGIAGTNGGGGSNSNDYSYKSGCSTCKTCIRWQKVTKCSCWNASAGGKKYCSHNTVCRTTTKCSSYKTESCKCKTSTVKGKSGNGGTSVIELPASMIQTVSGLRENNGYAKISYKLED